MVGSKCSQSWHLTAAAYGSGRCFQGNWVVKGCLVVHKGSWLVVRVYSGLSAFHREPLCFSVGHGS